jgi:nitroreductase
MKSKEKNAEILNSDKVELNTIKLLKPKFKNDKSLYKSLKKRQTLREFSDKKLSLQMLSNLLWAASGVNRKKGPFDLPGLTASTASDSQEIDIYVAMEEAVYLYNPINRILNTVIEEYLRKLALNKGQQDLECKAPIRLIFVADVEKLEHTKGFQEPGLQNPDVQKSYYFVDTGIIAQNVYLFAASMGLAAWFHNCNKTELSQKLNLRENQILLFSQTIGFPKKEK